MYNTIALASDAELLRRFEALELRQDEFGHREHLRLAFATLAASPDLAVAATRLRVALRRFAAAHGAAGKYHETITWAYLAMVAERMYGRDYASADALLADHSDLLDHRSGALARCYDVAAVTASPVARAVFVLPRRP
jgi:hypothetical protein